MAGKDSKTSSIQDIAKTLMVVTQPEDTTKVDEPEDVLDSPTEGTAETTDDDLTTDDLADDDSEDQGQETDSVDDTDDEADDDATDGTDDTIIDIRDDDVIDVMIDGKLETRTIAELKKAISGEGAIERRLQEATELRKTAHAERTTALEKLADQERLVANSLAALDESVFKPLIPAPDPKMKDTNPAAYMRHKDAYDEDQKRIATAKKAVQDKVQEFGAQRAQRLKDYGDYAAKEIARIIPELVDPQKSPTVLKELVSTAKAYGYSEEEISSALDPRMFHLVRDAMLYRKLATRSKEVKVSDLSSQAGKGPRKLRSGNTRAKSLVQLSAKRQADAKSQAAKTGKVKDVAAMLLKPKGQ